MISLPHFAPLSSRRSAGYTQKRLTENLKVPYYVGEQFSKEFTGVILKNLERTVEDDYISSLRNNCWKEKQQSTHAFFFLKVGSIYEATISLERQLKIVDKDSYLYPPWYYFHASFSGDSCRGGHAVQSSLFWRWGSVPKSAESSHAKLRQTLWDHGFVTRLRLHS